MDKSVANGRSGVCLEGWELPPEAPNGAPIPLFVALNDHWRVSFDPLQWILARRVGQQWIARSFCVTREALLRCIKDYCPKDVDLSSVHAFPDWHSDRSHD